jgi:hypothetical protein
MRSRDFAYWLQGFFEIDGDENRPLTAEQVRKIRNHLAMVFKHEIDPSFGDKKVQEELHKVHTGIQGVGGVQGISFPIGTTMLNC